MTKKQKPTKPKDQKAQAERFIEKARELGADESGEAFERAFRRVVLRTPRHKAGEVQDKD